MHFSTGSKMYDPDVASNKLFQTNTDEDEYKVIFRIIVYVVYLKKPMILDFFVKRFFT